MNARVNNPNNVPSALVPGWQPDSPQKGPAGPALPPKPEALRRSMENIGGPVGRTPLQSGNAPMARRVSSDRLSALFPTNQGGVPSMAYGRRQSAPGVLPYPVDDAPHLPNRFDPPHLPNPFDPPPQQGRQAWGQAPGHGMPSQPHAQPPIIPERPFYAPPLKHSLSFGNLQHVTGPQQSSLLYPVDDRPPAQGYRPPARPPYEQPPRNSHSQQNLAQAAAYPDPSRPHASPQGQGHYTARPETRPEPPPQGYGHGQQDHAQAAAHSYPSRPSPAHANSQWQGHYPAQQQARPAQPLRHSHSHPNLGQAALSSPQAQGHYASRPQSSQQARPLRPSQSEGNLAHAAARPQRPPPSQASGSGRSAFAAMKPFGEYSNEKYYMRQSLLTSMPEKKKNRFGITKSDSPENALRRQHVYHCLEVMDNYMDGHMNYVVKAGDKPAGMLSMSQLPDNRGVKINGVIGLPDTKGVGVHAIRAAIEKSLETGGGGRVELNYLPSNSANLLAFYTKAGFEEHGYFNDDGNYVTHMDLNAGKAMEFLRNTEGNSPRFVA